MNPNRNPNSEFAMTYQQVEPFMPAIVHRPDGSTTQMVLLSEPLMHAPHPDVERVASVRVRTTDGISYKTLHELGIVPDPGTGAWSRTYTLRA